MTYPQKRALLISGGLSSKWNYVRYRNDLVLWGDALRKRGFDCAVCYADGAGISIAGARVRSATQADVNAELLQLARLAPDDLAVVVVTNHGSRDGFCTWGTAQVSPTDLAVALGRCAATKVIVLGQCYSGVFRSVAVSRAVVITACDAGEESYACADPPGPDAYDEFLFHLADALFSAPGSAPPPTLRVAYDQAVTRDRRPETPGIEDREELAARIVLS